MKWVKVAIGAVIAIMSIGIIATSVYDMTQGSGLIKEVEFTIVYDDDIFTPITAFNDILEYSVIDNSNNVINIVSIYIDDNIDTDETEVSIGLNRIDFLGASSGYMDSFINDDGTWVNNGGSINSDVTVKLLFEVTQAPVLSGITATLLLLAPLIFAGGILAYLLNKQNY